MGAMLDLSCRRSMLISSYVRGADSMPLYSEPWPSVWPWGKCHNTMTPHGSSFSVPHSRIWWLWSGLHTLVLAERCGLLGTHASWPQTAAAEVVWPCSLDSIDPRCGTWCALSRNGILAIWAAPKQHTAQEHGLAVSSAQGMSIGLPGYGSAD